MGDMIKRERYETERLCIRHFDLADVDGSMSRFSTS